MELFIAQMKNLRGWPYEKSKIKWDELERDSAHFADNGGPSQFPKRLYIPAWLTGTEVKEFTVKEAEEKSRHEEAEGIARPLWASRADVWGTVPCPPTPSKSVAHSSVISPY